MFKNLLKDPKKFVDDRGSVEILYENGNTVFKRTVTKAGVLRGMHYQKPPYEQTKIFRVISGKILDFVTMPFDDDDYILGKEFTSEDGWIHIDSNLAHGFYSSEETVFEYFCDGAYNESEEITLRIDALLEKQLFIKDIKLSSKDKKGKKINKKIKMLNRSI